MSSRHIASIFLAALALTAMGYAFANRPQVLTSPTAVLHAPDSGALESEIAQLRASLEQLRAEQRGLASGLAAVVHTEPAATLPEAPPVTAPDEAQRAPEQTDPVDGFEARLSETPLDSKWSTWTADEIQRRALEHGLEPLPIDSLTCNESVCRLALRLDEARDQETFRALPYLIPWDAEGYTHIDPEAPNRPVVYIERQG